MLPLRTSRLLGIVGAVATTVALQAYGPYVWIPAAIIAYGITPIPWQIISRRRSERIVDAGAPLALSKLSNETIREQIIGMALMMPDGEQHLHSARDYLARMAARGRFNTERAIEVMTMTVDNAVWADVRLQKEGRLVYRDYKASGLGPIVGKELADRVIAEIGATDQRPTRRWLRFLLGA